MGIKCRLIEPIGLKYYVGFYWYVSEKYNEVKQEISKEEFDADFDTITTKYKHIAPTDQDLYTFRNGQRIWNTEDGENNHPGDMYWAPWMHEGGHCLYWDNCTDPRGHLIVVMPNNDGYWDTDSRASNCTMKDDKTHRCWVKHGEPPNVTVDKQGKTCQAGAGSIQMIHWHGYLRNGELVQ